MKQKQRNAELLERKKVNSRHAMHGSPHQSPATDNSSRHALPTGCAPLTQWGHLPRDIAIALELERGARYARHALPRQDRGLQRTYAMIEEAGKLLPLFQSHTGAEFFQEAGGPPADPPETGTFT